MTAGHVYTIAGTNSSKITGNGGPATSAGLGGIGALSTDSHGNILLASNFTHNRSQLRVIAGQTGTFYGQAMTAGHIYTIAGGGSSQPFGSLATSTALDAPAGLAVDAHGNVVLTDAKEVMVIAGQTGTFYGQAMTARHLYPLTVESNGGYNGDGQPASQAEVNDPQSVTLDGNGNIVLADTLNDRVRVIAAATGTFYGQAMQADYIYTVAGDGRAYSGGSGPAGRSVLDLTGDIDQGPGPDGVAQDPATGNVPFAATGANLVQLIAGRTGTFYGRSMKAGDLYTVAGNGSNAGSKATGKLATNVPVPGPEGVAVDAAGNLLFCQAL